MPWRYQYILKQRTTLYVASVDVCPRENQKHDRRDAKEHYATRVMAFVSTL